MGHLKVKKLKFPFFYSDSYIDSREIVLSSFSETYSSVSSAYCERLIPKLEMTLTIGDTYSENSNGPRTDP